MKQRLTVAGVLVLAGLTCRMALAAAPMAHPAEVTVLFSPGDGCTAAVILEIQKATRSVRVEAYDFHTFAIAQALVAAKARGVPVVEVLLDDNQEKDRSTQALFLQRNGIVPRVAIIPGGILNSRVVMVDDGTVLTGSFGFTEAAERRNAENLVILRSEGLAADYRAEFFRLAGNSRPYVWQGALPAP
jgi:phosphatidylserine/phosphatidylglycerophosphate/cardiolipin synthase-like enzyme